MAEAGESNPKAEDPMKFWSETLNGARYVMAPMVDMSELAFRMLGRDHGVQLCYTPMLHAQRYINEDHYRKHFFTTCSEDRPLIVQEMEELFHNATGERLADVLEAAGKEITNLTMMLACKLMKEYAIEVEADLAVGYFGEFCANDPETFVTAAKMVENHCDAVDLNLGCPQIIARKGHYGSFLQDEWDLVAEIVGRAARELRVPVTCKIRVHRDVARTVEYARMIERAGCKLLTVHGRTREQKGHNTGVADWDIIRKIRSSISIPMFANGNILSRDDADRCMSYTGVQGVMAAEGLLHNPALFADSYPPVCQMARRYIGYCRKHATEAGHVRTHLLRILAYSLELYPDLRTRLAEASKIPIYEEIISELEAKLRTDFEQEMSIYEKKSDERSEENSESGNCRESIRSDVNSTEVTSDTVTAGDSERTTELNNGSGPLKRRIPDSDGANAKKMCPDSAAMATESSERWKDFPRWSCHARARVAKSTAPNTTSPVDSERPDGNPDQTVAGNDISVRTKENKTERKLRQFERRVAGKKLKRQQKRDDRKERRAELLAQGVSLKRELDEDHVTKKDRVVAIRERLETAMKDGQRVCIDMGLEHLMTQKESAKLAQQICRLYGSNRKSERPFHLCMTSLNKDGVLYKECVRKNMGFDNYLIDKHERSHLEVFAHDEIVYLSPDAEHELERLEMGKVYMIGGLVDETVNKGRTTEAAQKANIHHAKLPLDKYMRKGEKGNYCKILTVNQVFDILLTYHSTGSWREALSEHVPPRTGYVLKDEDHDNT